MARAVRVVAGIIAIVLVGLTVYDALAAPTYQQQRYAPNAPAAPASIAPAPSAAPPKVSGYP